MIGQKVVGEETRKLTVFTVATEKNDGYERFIRSTKLFNIEVVALGMGESWQGGDMRFPAGGWKVNLLKAELERRKGKEEEEGMMLFTDSYDVVFTAGKESILGMYDKLGGGLVFGAEGFCWPKASLENEYPEVQHGNRFLNSGGFIGPMGEVRKLLEAGGDLGNTEDDQLFYTRIYLNQELRSSLDMRLDHAAALFQNLNGEADNIEIRFENNSPYVYNMKYESLPMVIHGNGPSKTLLNTLASYVPGGWSMDDGCIDCWRDTLDIKENETPLVLMAVFIEQPTPFMDEFWDKLVKLDYDKASIHLLIHNAVGYHGKQAAEFVQYWKNPNEVSTYHSIEYISEADEMDEVEARNRAVERCAELKCDSLFVVDSTVHLDNPAALSLLLEQNRAVVAPVLIRPYTPWSNFWGALSSGGFYARSLDYMEIVRNERRGLWNVPYLSACYLVAGDIIMNTKTRPDYASEELDPDMAFAESLRDRGVFMYVSNRVNFGHLVNAENFPTNHLNNELWEMERNKYDWELRYLHVNYSQSLEEGNKPQQPCPDVYWFPMFTERFCDEFVGEAEHFGKWSDGSNTDNRLDSGYEAVPTRDIHMNQIEYHTEWMYILENYVRPLQESVFIGYFHTPVNSIMNFMVRYRPDEQPSLRPHHDSSTYTINVALNHKNIDFEGGGCNFLRYNCSVESTKKGHMLMHPGRLTHYHEGLTTTAGTRYIMISFVNP